MKKLLCLLLTALLLLSLAGCKTASQDPENPGTSEESTGSPETGTETTDTTDELTRTGTDTDTETLNLTDTERKTGEGLTSTSKNGTRTDNLTEEYTETKTRGGNIGVTSTQSLINQEREVARFSFIEVVCKTITDAVCMGVYD